jgi:ADP-heptose:LPS heptosyltransferase
LNFNKVIIWLFSRLLFRQGLPESPTKILVYRWGSIGDCICAFPAIFDINKNYPNAILDIENNCPGASTPFMKLLLNPEVYRMVFNSGNMSRGEYFQTIKQEKYDIYFMLLGSKNSLFPVLKRMILIRLAGIKYGMGWDAYFISFLRKTQVKFFDFDPMINYLKKTLIKNNIPVSIKNHYPLNIQPADELVINKTIQQTDLNKKNIALSIGGSAENRKWKIENYQAIADFLSPNFNVLIVGGKEDFEKGKQLKNVHNFCGTLTIMQSALLMNRCLVTISNDTGPMHLSYAIGTPVIGLFSNWEFPNTWHPPNNNLNVALRAKNIPCEVCLLTECPYNNLCINEIKIDVVTKEVQNLINKIEKNEVV